jgi:hypothetical protein
MERSRGDQRVGDRNGAEAIAELQIGLWRQQAIAPKVIPVINRRFFLPEKEKNSSGAQPRESADCGLVFLHLL